MADTLVAFGICDGCELQTPDCKTRQSLTARAFDSQEVDDVQCSEAVPRQQAGCSRSRGPQDQERTQHSHKVGQASLMHLRLQSAVRVVECPQCRGAKERHSSSCAKLPGATRVHTSTNATQRPDSGQPNRCRPTLDPSDLGRDVLQAVGAILIGGAQVAQRRKASACDFMENKGLLHGPLPWTAIKLMGEPRSFIAALCWCMRRQSWQTLLWPLRMFNSDTLSCACSEQQYLAEKAAQLPCRRTPAASVLLPPSWLKLDLLPHKPTVQKPLTPCTSMHPQSLSHRAHTRCIKQLQIFAEQHSAEDYMAGQTMV